MLRKELYKGEYFTFFEDGTFGCSDGVGFVGEVDISESIDLYNTMEKFFGNGAKEKQEVLAEAICEVLRLSDGETEESEERNILNKALKECGIARWSEPCDPLKAIRDVINKA